MEKYLIYSDLHIGGPHEIKAKFIFSRNTVFLGDNFDIRNVIRNKLPELKNFREATIKKVNSKKGIYVSGNHSLEPLKNYFKIRKGTLFIHGDIFKYEGIKAKKWRNKKKGRTKFSWKILSLIQKFYTPRTIFFKKPILAAYNFAKSKKAKTIVIGHFHPKKLMDINYKNIRIVFVPRGMTKINL